MNAVYPLSLICTDFDGTLVDQDPWDRPPDGFFEAVRELRRSGGQWVINTGRDWHSLCVELTAREFSEWPDWVVLVEREIHAVRDREIIPWTEWNDRCAAAHRELFSAKAALLDRLYEVLRRSVRVSFQIHADPGSPLAIIADNEVEAERTHALINEILAEDPGMMVVRNSVYFRFSHPEYNKGTCLNALSKRIGAISEKVFAIGDHWNDLPMLERSIAHNLACPANGIEAVKKHVRKEGGYVAKGKAGKGVLEALEHFVRSKQP
ncbi:MAG: Cof-type HAD-IIB family hydrolase [Methylacidiphilales bacterium]|nr:Cof-type HAD-IIB family hydrolase [Candidatus Methylacidiphilales bacterium]MDW8349413.1 HAD family hydrolase [Verrucomicrobiae bacterium]